ncbi:GAG-pre-integrase domain-containing protein, partial [Klebsiella pneumoniae]|uniref:GAG-pre-integrase domain-containing protein n=1 Tax=Klebsiella pneumoniae TaxID=573 RepID=UPI003A7F7E1A
NEEHLSKIKTYQTSNFVSTADGTTLKIQSTGFLENLEKRMHIPNVRCVPKLNLNLLSVSQITDHGCKVTFLPEKCFIQDIQSEKMIGEGCRRGDLYYMSFLDLSKTFCNIVKEDQVSLWHQRLGHTSSQKLSCIPSLRKFCNDIFQCEDCIYGKMKTLPFESSMSSSNLPFELIHSDVWGPSGIS